MSLLQQIINWKLSFKQKYTVLIRWLQLLPIIFWSWKTTQPESSGWSRGSKGQGSNPQNRFNEFRSGVFRWWKHMKTTILHVILLIEELLHQLIGSLSMFIPLVTRFYTSQVVQELFPSTVFSRWWFQGFFIFNPTWGDNLLWLIFFRWAVQPPTSFTYQLNSCVIFCCSSDISSTSRVTKTSPTRSFFR